MDPERGDGTEPVRGFLLRRRGTLGHDLYLRSTLALALGGTALVLVVPGAGALVGMALYTLWVSGPLSPLFPVGLEPVVMLLGRLHRPFVVAATVTAAGLWVEVLNVHLYRSALRHRASARFRGSRLVTRLQRWFERAPFLTTWVLGWSPLPFWAGRILAALSGYSMMRFLLATLLGRLPKFWIFAALGMHWQLPVGLLVAVVVAGTAVALVLWVVRTARKRGCERSDAGFPTDEEEASRSEA